MQKLLPDGNYEQSVEYLRRAAVLGNMDAAKNLGAFFANGLVGKDAYDILDYKTAIGFLRQAHERNHHDAIYSLGYVLLMSHVNTYTLRADLEEAITLLTRSVEEGEPRAARTLEQAKGELRKYAERDLLFAQAKTHRNSKEYAAAAGDFMRVALHGNRMEAMYNLGWILHVKKDYESALQWFKSAEAFGSVQARKNIAKMTAKGRVGPFPATSKPRLQVTHPDFSITLMHGGGITLVGRNFPSGLLAADRTDKKILQWAQRQGDTQIRLCAFDTPTASATGTS